MCGDGDTENTFGVSPGDTETASPEGGEFRLPLPYTPPTYPKDSIYFVHKDAHYIPGYNPLFLCWRDKHLSKYAVDTTDYDGKMIEQKMTVSLEVTKRGRLRTLEKINVAQISDEDRQKLKAPRGTLVRCFINPTDIDLKKRKIRGIQIDEKASKLKGSADCMSRILWQCMQRMDDPPLTYNHVLQTISEREEGIRSGRILPGAPAPSDDKDMS
eukprot:GDKI01029368.1.p1 GENE.GDKI01029368.1~~GDKI01029368.1.p1  ORF type:complete len:225 (-),score=68.31 GDKI01029368.1:365-1006(-)